MYYTMIAPMCPKEYLLEVPLSKIYVPIVYNPKKYSLFHILLYIKHTMARIHSKETAWQENAILRAKVH